MPWNRCWTPKITFSRQDACFLVWPILIHWSTRSLQSHKSRRQATQKRAFARLSVYNTYLRLFPSLGNALRALRTLVRIHVWCVVDVVCVDSDTYGLCEEASAWYSCMFFFIVFVVRAGRAILQYLKSPSSIFGRNIFEQGGLSANWKQHKGSFYRHDPVAKWHWSNDARNCICH